MAACKLGRDFVIMFQFQWHISESCTKRCTTLSSGKIICIMMSYCESIYKALNITLNNVSVVFADVSFPFWWA